MKRRLTGPQAGLIVLVLLVGVLTAGFLRNSTPETGQVVVVTSDTNAYTPTPAGTPETTAEPDPDEPEPNREKVTVGRVIDGDTIEVAQSAQDVRILGIDTPETVHPTKGVQCYGPQASAATKKLLPADSTATLTFEGERTDRYGRLLAYVENEDGLDVSAELAGKGLARVYDLRSRYRVARTPELLTLQAQARTRGIGLWGACPA